ncbi:hypothetical protein [Streptomyces sp. NBC_01264]|uniref:hypothetical protein n=1 Tax=Streptomyces sp. NBC_01264 TaxID=2903804 RepID=UPI00225C2300|nr:hypothetical protein [Streptomyces sp. NBC_01264]MCX4784589.1 hypothetical protein [Streptomyces sp. NBC_01264]
MRTTRRIAVTLAAAAISTGIFGLQAAQAAPAPAQTCAVETRQSRTTADHYALTNIDAFYRTDAPPVNARAVYRLSDAPQNCADGEFYLLDVLTNRVIPMAGKTSTGDWRGVSFTLTSQQRFVQVMYGNPHDPWSGDFIGSVSKLMFTS